MGVIIGLARLSPKVIFNVMYRPSRNIQIAGFYRGRAPQGLQRSTKNRMLLRHEKYSFTAFIRARLTTGIGLLDAYGRRDHCSFRARRTGRHPVVAHRQRSVHPIADRVPTRRFAQIRTDVFPNVFTAGGYLEKPPVHAFVDQGVAVGQTPRAADERAVERPAWLLRIGRAVLPDDFIFLRVDFQDPRAGDQAKGDVRIARRALVVEHQQIAGAGQPGRDDVRIVLADELIDRTR